MVTLPFLAQSGQGGRIIHFIEPSDDSQTASGLKQGFAFSTQPEVAVNDGHESAVVLWEAPPQFKQQIDAMITEESGFGR